MVDINESQNKKMLSENVEILKNAIALRKRVQELLRKTKEGK